MKIYISIRIKNMFLQYHNKETILTAKKSKNNITRKKSSKNIGNNINFKRK